MTNTNILRYQDIQGEMVKVQKYVDQFSEGECTDAHGRFVSMAIELAIAAMDPDNLANHQNAYFATRLDALKAELDSWLPR